MFKVPAYAWAQHCRRRMRSLRLWSLNCAVAGCLTMQGLAALAADIPDLLMMQSGLSSRTQILLENLDHVRATPFDGLTINIPASWDGTLKTTQLDYDVVYGDWLAPLVGTLPKLSRSYLLMVVRDMGDPFDDWSQVIRNWETMARAARDAGMQGLWFDNEAYYEPYFDFPQTVRYPKRGLAAYQAQFRLRGEQIMQRLRALWPQIKIVHLHGPYVSEPATPPEITLEQVAVSARDLRGYFFAGMLRRAQAPAQAVDGGELYQYRTALDFERSAAWRRNGIAEVPDSSLVPPGIAQLWRQRIPLSFGVYDLQWKPDYPMTPQLLEEALYQALLHADAPVWLYSETPAHDYLVPGGVAPEWMQAVERAKQRAQAAKIR
jgi:hypothetical protein